MKIAVYIFLVALGISCNSKKDATVPAATPGSEAQVATTVSEQTLVILGVAQDGGAPHIGCKKDCCKDRYLQPRLAEKVVSLGIADPVNNKSYLFEATPDIATQMKQLQRLMPGSHQEMPDAIFLTHAHIGHYTGLMYLGKEAMFANKVPVYAMPRMKYFLELNGPWNQLIHYKNIVLQPLADNTPVKMGTQLKITPFLVPHRDEYAETVGYRIEGLHKKILFIPDIDKWSKWDSSIITAIAAVDYAFIDGTFYNGEEINNRDIREIPHPFVIETMQMFDTLPAKEKNKIWFIHLNHTNPLLNNQHPASDSLSVKGYHVASEGLRFKL